MTDLAAIDVFFAAHPGYFFLAFLAAVWSITWKGIALWKAARLGHRNWFIALLVVNTIGILEIIYIYWFSRKQGEPQNSH